MSMNIEKKLLHKVSDLFQYHNHSPQVEERLSR